MVETIGQRAVEQIYDHARVKNTSFNEECFLLDINPHVARYWARSNRNPNAMFLQTMALAGYDIIYILTGERVLPKL